jgi:hypothetical protein
MKRFYVLAIALGLFASVGLVGCGEENKTTTEVKTETPTGSTTEKVTKETETTGEAPPPASGASGVPAPAPQ